MFENITISTACTQEQALSQYKNKMLFAVFCESISVNVAGA